MADKGTKWFRIVYTNTKRGVRALMFHHIDKILLDVVYERLFDRPIGTFLDTLSKSFRRMNELPQWIASKYEFRNAPDQSLETIKVESRVYTVLEVGIEAGLRVYDITITYSTEWPNVENMEKTCFYIQGRRPIRIQRKISVMNYMEGEVKNISRAHIPGRRREDRRPRNVVHMKKNLQIILR